MAVSLRAACAVFALALLALTVAASVVPAMAQVPPAGAPAQPFRQPPALGRAYRQAAGPAPLSASQGPLFDEQLGITYQSTTTSVIYNVTAVAQSDKATGYGPAYLVNGLTNEGFWYQIGVSYDWPYIGTGYFPGFGANFEVFNSSGSSVFPAEGGGLLNFSGPVNPGDEVQLSLFFAGGNITMQADDLSTGASASIGYGSQGADSFIGISNGPANPDGFFTGLMTEWYHGQVYKSNPSEVIYSTEAAERSGLMWMDEFNTNNSKLIFSVVQPTPSVYTDPTQLVALAANGALLYSDAYRFISGGLLGVQTAIDLKPGPDTPALSPSQGFLVTYSANGTLEKAYDAGALNVTSDAGSTIGIAGVSSGSNSTTRWALDAEGLSVSVEAGTPTDISYRLQYALTTLGVSPARNWWDKGTQANVSVPGAFGRVNGTGLRVASYTLDGGPPVLVAPTASEVNVSVTMSTSHTLDFGTVTQYEVVLEGAATTALASATPPTIPGDARWYDGGTSVAISLHGVWGRSGGSGERLTSVSTNGGAATTVATTGLVEALDGPITGPVAINGTAVKQYQLATNGSVAAATPTPVPGDSGWYDAGTRVNASLGYSWDIVANQSRLNAVSYSVDGGQTVSLPRAGGGAFTVSVAMNSPQQISVSAATQFYLGVVAQAPAAVLPPSPTRDGFFDQGTQVSVSAPFTEPVGADERQVLASYSLDGRPTQVVWQPAGAFRSESFAMDGPHDVVLTYADQYLVEFQTLDASGTVIHPTSLTISAGPGAPEAVNATQAWLGGGTSFRISSLIWEGENVAPAAAETYQVEAPLNITLRALVYEATLRVLDYIGVPLSGVGVTATLANGTVVRVATAADGVAALGDIPLGTFTASVASPLGTVTSGGNASEGQLAVRVAGAPTLALAAAFAVLVAAVALLARRRGRAQPVPGSA